MKILNDLALKNVSAAGIDGQDVRNEILKLQPTRPREIGTDEDFKNFGQLVVANIN